MEIKPLEIANICSIFYSNRTSRIQRSDLLKYTESCLLIDSDKSPESIIRYCLEIHILYEINDEIHISEIGKKLGKSQDRPQYILPKRTKDFFIKNILLNAVFIDKGFISIINCFQPVQKYKTYVYFRTFDEDNNLINWLKAFHSVGLTIISDSVFLINYEYLEVFNLFLYRIRTNNFDNEDPKGDFRKEIGDLAENFALDFERERLTKQGYPELAKLIEHLSLIDNYLGYDILSFQGKGKNPARKRYIEVKGTTKPEYQFIFSKNERKVAADKKNQFWLYCFKNVKSSVSSVKGPLMLCNPIKKLKEMNVIEEPDDIFYLIK